MHLLVGFVGACNHHILFCCLVIVIISSSKSIYECHLMVRKLCSSYEAETIGENYL